LTSFLTSFLPEIQEIEVTDKPATTEAPPAEKAFARTISPIIPENETEIVEAGKEGGSRATSYPITYHGGPVMTAPGTTCEFILPSPVEPLISTQLKNKIFFFPSLVLYLIMYGRMDASTKSIIQTFASGVGGTPWWSINRQYSGVGQMPLLYIVTDTTYSAGTYLTAQAMWNYIRSLTNRGILPLNSNAVYMLVTSR
jgi:hypothetical protein